MVEIFLVVGILLGNTELTDVVEFITSVVVIEISLIPYIELLIKPALKQIYQ